MAIRIKNYINNSSIRIFYSDKNVYIRKVGTDELYKEATLVSFKDRYEETDTPLPVREEKTVVKETIKEE